MQDARRELRRRTPSRGDAASADGCGRRSTGTNVRSRVAAMGREGRMDVAPDTLLAVMMSVIPTSLTVDGP